MRQLLENEEVYHIYNRGVEKRDIFTDAHDVARFLQSMEEFNRLEPIGSLYQHSFRKKNSLLSGKTAQSEKLVEVIAYCLNPNHFHFILRQVAVGGISEFMKRLSGGYTWYFNHKYERESALFQGSFKSRHIATNVYLLHLSAYVNLNNEVHRISEKNPLFVGVERSSWNEYVLPLRKKDGQCEKRCILEQFKNCKEYEVFARNSLRGIIERKQMGREVEPLLLE